MFNLLRYFSFASAVALTVVTVVLVLFYRQYAVSELVESAENQNVTLARSFANVLWPRFSHYVASVSGMDGDALRARPETRELDAALKTLTTGLPVLKVKIYDLDGLTVYSSQPSQMGVDKSNNLGFLQSARDGMPASKLSYRDTFSAFSGTVGNRDLVESYLPIWAGDGAIEGVFELYTDVTPLVAKIERRTIELIAGLLLSFGLLYGVLCLIVRRADRILGRQYSELKQAEEALGRVHDELETRVLERTIELRSEITERKRTEQALQESEERFRAVVDNSPTKIHIKDADGRYVLINRQAERMFGVTDEGARGKTTHEIFAKEQAEAFVAHDQAVLQNGETIEQEEEWIQEDGVRTFLTVKFPIQDGSGQVIAVGAIGTDITERKRAEHALRESEERFRALVEHAPEAITMLDVDTGLYLDANPRAEALHGLPRDALIGKLGPADLSPEIQPDGRPSSEAASDYMSRALAGEFPRFEWMHLDPDGQETLCEVSLARLPDPHRSLVRASISDITERKAAEEQLRQAQKMDAVGQLTAGVAHDFNNMLAVIWGNAEMLEDEIGKDNPQLAAVFRGTKRGADLTQRLLAFSRKQVLKPEIVNANSMIAEVTGLLRRTLEEHIDIETVTTAGLWNCEVDPAQLENALVNLAINARDAMPDGGKLTIETANARLDDDYAAAQADVTPGQYVMLAVTDTGTGMPPEVREHVFEPFFSTKEVGKGTGLGLAMVYGFVKQSGGHVTIYSEEGEGTTIKLYLPRSTETEAVEQMPVMDEVPAARGETVLVVEDDPDLLTLAVALLSKLGYQLMEARTGASALEQLGSTTRVNLLLTDVVLPGGMNGRELATEAERRAPGIQVLFMSGYTEDAIVHHGRLDANAELLQKPFRRADLARAVRKVLDG